MSAIKITVTSCENPEHFYVFQEATVAQAVAALVVGMTEQCFYECHEAIGLLVETVGKAIQDPKGFAKEWDFSAPEDAFTVQFEEIEDSSSCGGNECCGCPVCTPDECKTVEYSPWRHDNAHDSAKAGIDVEEAPLDVQPVDIATVEYMMFQELDLECTGYQFTQCPWDSLVGRECMKVLRKAHELITMLPDLDCHQSIWHAAFIQCDILYCG